MRKSPHQPGGERTRPPFRPERGRWLGRLGNWRLRDTWWRVLDFFESNRLARAGLYLTAFALVLGFATYLWVYPAWARRNSIRIARQWLEAGQLRYAADAAKRAAELAPDSPEPWTIAAELARRGAQFEQASDYSARAAELSADEPALLLNWAADAVRAGRIGDAVRALDRLPPDYATTSPHALRLRGEIARRQGRLSAALRTFEAALKLEGPLAVNEVPIGLVLLSSTYDAERQRGLGLLAKWSADREWGATALRQLLEDAVTHQDKPAMQGWAEALRAHPGCTVADMPRCLAALHTANPSRYGEILAGLQRDHAGTPQAAAQLLTWLNQIGRGADVVAWIRTLPAADMERPPLSVAAAEAIRQAGDWPALQAWTAAGDWGPDADFLRWTYGLAAASRLGDATRAAELQRSLLGHAQLNATHGYFAGSMLYGWGFLAEAVELWWRVADQPGPVAADALGSLARHFQVRRDADGQYRAFRGLHFLRPGDAAIGNNFAFFAALTHREERVADDISRANLQADPRNEIYIATRGFALLQQGRISEALAVLQPKSAVAARSPALGFAYGLVLAESGNLAEARALLRNLPPETLTTAELELIREKLKD